VFLMTARRFLPALLLLFVGSGCAALIYEIVWFQLLQLVIGSSAASLGVLLGTFMGGMCLGSLLLSRFVGPGQHPLRVYAYLELGIGAIGVLVLLAMPLVGGLYFAWSVHGAVGIFVRGLAASIILLPPTFLMGATLPAISRWVESTPEGVSWLGFFYGGNIAGGVLGCLTAGFYLLRVHDVTIATLVAVGLNVTVAVLALVIARLTPYTANEEAKTTLKIERSAGAWAVYVAIGLSGMTALGAEVIWTRILSLLFGATVYTFSLILAVFLLGLGIGSSIGSSMAARVSRPRLALGWCQMLLCAAIAWTAYMLTQSLPYWPINPSITTSMWYNFQLDVVRCLWAVLPAAILWGASFPLALASVAQGGKDPAKLVGGVYAANTLGAIIGSVMASFVMVVWLGSQHAQQVLVVIAAISALLMIESASAEAESKKTKFQLAGTLLLVAAMGGAVLLARSIQPVPGVLVAYGRYAATRLYDSEIIYMGEGWNASVAVSRQSNGVLNYHNAGKVQASSEPQDMRLQRMLGHLTTLIPKNPESVLVIGCGAGVTAGAVSVDPNVKKLTIAEIEPLVPRVVSRFFAEHNFDVVANPKTRVEIDDARHFLLTTDEKLQLYESNTAAVKSEIGTFLEAFPNGVVFGNTNNGAGYDLVLLGQVEPTRIDVEAVQRLLDRPEMAPVVRSLGEIGLYSAIDLFSNYAGTKKDLAPWLADAIINRDRNLRLQYLAGMGFNLYQSEAIYADMLQYSQYPDDLFVGSDQMKMALRDAIARMQGKSGF
jgi:spermidine synthase